MSLSTPAYALPDRPSRSLRTLRASGGARVGTVILVVVGICAMAPHLLAPFDPTEQRLLARFTPPLTRAADGTLAVLGTDQLGRDILSRLIYGARTSSLIGFLAVLLAGFTGTALGLLAGVRGGASDHTVLGRHARRGPAIRGHALLAGPLPRRRALHDRDGHQSRGRHAPRYARSLSLRASKPGTALMTGRHLPEGGSR